jgi:RNA polymerase sigma factor (sigma-70 family)
MDHLADCTCDQCLLIHMKAASAAERQRGWEAWYQRDAPTIQAYIQRRCFALRCPEHSEDILQDCFLIGFKNVSNGNYREQGMSLCAYLIGIAKNLLHEMLRLQRREPATLSQLEIEDRTALSLDDSIYLEEIVSGVREGCTYLSHHHQRVAEGVYIEGKSSSELAEELGKSPGNIRAIAHRAVREIGQYLECQHSMYLSPGAIRACLEAL